MVAYASAFKDSRPGVTLVGAGALGRVLAARLHERGYPVLGVVSKTREHAEALGRKVEARIYSSDIHDLPPATRLLILCVPDGALEKLAEKLRQLMHPWRQTVVLHTSGALPARVLQPLENEGARILSFHPLQALTPRSDASALDGVYAGIEGEAPAVAAGVELAANLGMRYLVLSAEDKPRYHLAATIASNYLVTLQAIVQQVAESLAIDRDTAQAVMAPLVRGTLDNLEASTPEDALTGPVVRGDLDTVRQHGLALRRDLPALVPVYAALAMETVTLAVRSGRLDPAQAEEMLDLIDKMVTLPLPARKASAA